MDTFSKKSIAYHEAGHYLVLRLSEKVKDIKCIAVSIIPAVDYLGINVLDDLSEEVIVDDNREYYIHRIAMYLAGREAERLFTKTISSGAEADLKAANKLAYRMINNWALVTNNVSEYSIYLEDSEYHMISEEVINRNNKEKEQILKEAAELAKTTILENKQLLEKLVNALLKKGILSEKELDKIFS